MPRTAHRAPPLESSAEVQRRVQYCQQLREEGLPTAEISTRLGISVAAVLHALDETAITIMPRSSMPDVRRQQPRKYADIISAALALQADQSMRVKFPSAEPAERRKWYSSVRDALRQRGIRVIMRSDIDALWIALRKEAK
jgi:hypothetical protein